MIPKCGILAQPILYIDMQQRKLIPVDLPTKPYLKAYIHKVMGDKPVMNAHHHIGSKLIDLLQRHENERRTRYSSTAYPCKIRVYLPLFVYSHRGGFINETNIIAWNSYLQSYFKDYMHQMLDVYLELTQSVDASIELMRSRVGLDEKIFPYDMIKKSYYRYRRDQGNILPKGGLKKLAYCKIDTIL